MRPKATRFALLVCILGFGGCNGGGLTGQQNASVTGAWQANGTSTANPGTGFEIEMNLGETNGQVFSTAFLDFGSCSELLPSQATVTGTVSGSKVSLTVSHLLTMTGTVSGPEITGTYNCGSDSGTWTALQVPLLNGNYGGTLLDRSSGQATPFTAFVSANSSYSITGSTTFIFSVCFGQLTFSGTQIGGHLGITGTDGSGDSIDFELTSTDVSFGRLIGAYGVGGNCMGQSGTATLTKQ